MRNYMMTTSPFALQMPRVTYATEGDGGGEAETQQKPIQGESGVNNTGANANDFAQLWEAKPAEKNVDNPQQPQFQQQVQKDDPAALLAQHFKNIGLEIPEMPEGLKETLGEEGAAYFQRMAAGMQKSYLQAMRDGKQLLEEKFGETEEVSKRVVDDKFSLEAMRGKLNTALPYTTNPAIKPVAESVMRQFMSKGKTVDEAVTGVKEFFNYMIENTMEFAPADLAAKTGGFKKPQMSKTDWEDFFEV